MAIVLPSSLATTTTTITGMTMRRRYDGEPNELMSKLFQLLTRKSGDNKASTRYEQFQHLLNDVIAQGCVDDLNIIYTDKWSITAGRTSIIEACITMLSSTPSRYAFMQRLIDSKCEVGAPRDSSDSGPYMESSHYGTPSYLTPLEQLCLERPSLPEVNLLFDAGCALWCHDQNTTLLFHIASSARLGTPAAHGVITRLVQHGGIDWSMMKSSGSGAWKRWYTAVDILCDTAYDHRAMNLDVTAYDGGMTYMDMTNEMVAAIDTQMVGIRHCLSTINITTSSDNAACDTASSSQPLVSLVHLIPDLIDIICDYLYRLPLVIQTSRL